MAARKIVRGRCFDLHYCGTGADSKARIGLIVPKRLARAASLRNAIKRQGREAFRLLRQISFFTVGEDEVRAWMIPEGTKAPQAAGTIHNDFERGFIRAERVHWQALVEAGTVGRAREAGHYAQEGRSYEVQDGDVLLFKFQG